MPKFDIRVFYMRTAIEAAKLSYCERKKVGCVIIKDNNILSFGYNGTPTGFDNTCEINDTTRKETLHAESNALAKLAKSNMSSLGADIFTTYSPCFECAKLIIQSGIKRVYYLEEYRDLEGIEFLQTCGIECFHFTLTD